MKVLALARETGFGILGLDYSPIRGPEGNIEYLMYLCKGADALSEDDWVMRTAEVVEAAHEDLQKGT